MKRAALALILGLTASPAFADDCPTAETAAAGFVAELPNGQRFSVRSTNGPLVESSLFAGPNKRQQTTYFEGFFPLESITPNQVLQLKPPGKLGEFFPLKTGASVEMHATPTINGSPGKPWTITLYVIDERDHQVGSCRFKVFRINRKIVEEGGKLIVDIVDYYAPTLRFVIARETKGEDGKTKVESYKTIRPRGRSGKL
jgi:hypothetical protein